MNPQRDAKRDWLRWGCLVAAVWMLFFGVVPQIFMQVSNTGTLLLTVGGLAFLAGTYAMGSQRLGKRQQRRLRSMMGIALGTAAGVLVVHGAIWNYYAYGRSPQTQGPATVVVLGCKINEDEPSLMLRRRLEAALAYLAQNPQANCVVSGGQGEGEEHSEASVMAQFLMENGVEPQRIYLEDRSTNTDTNLRYSLELIRSQGLSENLVIATDGFHQWRAYLYARRYGAQAQQVKAVSGRTPPLVIPGYALRELAGVAKMLVFG